MAYQVISQNNTTTTLQDENGNIVHVPAKTVLATSTEYEISEVNNSTATLTSSDGKVIRGIPCVAILSGSEGGGGGAVSSVNGQTGDVVITGNDVLPDQTGQSGKFLTTDGTDASWSDKPLVNRATGTNGIGIGGSSLVASGNNSIAVGPNPQATAAGAIAMGVDARATVADGIAVGDYAHSTANKAYQIGSGVNSTANSFQVGRHQLLNLSDGTIPSDRLVHAINKYSTMPTAASTNEGWIVQFTGTTDSTYTHGHLYECVSDGGNPATYSWTEVSMGGGSGLPAQTGNAGKFLTTDGTDASWSDKPLVNQTTNSGAVQILSSATPANYSNYIGVGASAVASGSVIIGNSASSVSARTVAIGKNATVSAQGGIAIGHYMSVTANNAIQIGHRLGGGAYGTNSDANTFKVANANGNFEIMSADGTIPAARHAALPAADGTYTLQLVIADGVPTLSWVAE